MPFSAVICLLALILMHLDAALKSLAADGGSEREGRIETGRNHGWNEGKEWETETITRYTPVADYVIHHSPSIVANMSFYAP